MTTICGECGGTGIVRAPEYDISTACGCSGTIVNYYDFPCPECDGKGLKESPWLTIPHGQYNRIKDEMLSPQ